MRKRPMIDFNKNLRYYILGSGILLLIGIICNVFLGPVLDINFKGGTRLSYQYTGELNPDDIERTLKEDTGLSVEVITSQDFTGEMKKIDISLVEDEAATVEAQSKIEATLLEKFKDNEPKLLTTISVAPSVGLGFFMKSLYTVALAGLLVIIYIGLRFRKIGGFSAGVTAFIALVHDVLIAYFVCIVFRLPIGDNFVAVVLTILGYSLNDTIVIYDRVRENRTIFGNRKPIDTLVNDSINQTLGRTIMTSVATFLAIATVVVVAEIMGMTSIRSFALPMCIGVVSGNYSSICIAGPLWVKWQQRKEKRDAIKEEQKKQLKRSGGKKK